MFTLMLEMKYSDAETLVTQRIYIFLARGWLLFFGSRSGRRREKHT